METQYLSVCCWCVQDAHEFLSQVLDQLKDEMDNTVGKMSAADKDGSDMAAECKCSSRAPVAANFEFEVVHYIKCTGYDVMLCSLFSTCTFFLQNYM